MICGAAILLLAEIHRFVSVQFKGAEDFVATIVLSIVIVIGALWSMKAEKTGKKLGAIIFCSIIAILMIPSIWSSISTALYLRTDTLLDPYVQEKPFLRTELILRALVNAGGYLITLVGYFVFLASRKKNTEK